MGWGVATGTRQCKHNIPAFCERRPRTMKHNSQSHIGPHSVECSPSLLLELSLLCVSKVWKPNVQHPQKSRSDLQALHT